MKKLHLLVGIVGTIVFLATGMYMRIRLNGLTGMEDLPRMMFRSSHIYLLLTSLINLSIGLYQSSVASWSRLQWTGSILVLIAPLLMLIAFFNEPALHSFERPFAGPGVYAVFAGMALHFIAALKNRT